jgi:hypothetical protein
MCVSSRWVDLGRRPVTLRRCNSGQAVSRERLMILSLAVREIPYRARVCASKCFSHSPTTHTTEVSTSPFLLAISSTNRAPPICILIGKPLDPCRRYIIPYYLDSCSQDVVASFHHPDVVCRICFVARDNHCGPSRKWCRLI